MRVAAAAPASARRPAADGGRLAERARLRGGSPRVQLTEIQRSRLLMGAVGAIEEHGYAGMTVAHITARAKVSRRTFYELFEDREACVVTLVEDVLGLLEGELERAGLEGLPWLERVRGGLVVILGFFDREPAFARMCVVQALSSGPRMLERRQEVLARLAGVLDEGRNESPRGAHCTALTAEGLVGAAFGILHARLLRGDREALLGLVGELMGMIVLPYRGPAAARREQAASLSETSASAPGGGPSSHAAPSEDPLEGLRMRWTYRTVRVMQGVFELSGASNRAVADYAGIQDQGQVSKLLARLQRLGLIANTGDGGHKGEPNAWSLTPLGEQVAQRLNINIPAPREQAA